MKALLVYFIVLLWASNIANAQVPVPSSLTTAPNVKCYWSYSVQRTSTLHDSLHKYKILVGIEQIDSSGKHKGRLRLKHVSIYCRFTEKGIPKKIYCRQVGLHWIAKFAIHTDQPLPVEIVAKYKDHETVMPFKLNEGTYPGEPDK